MKPVALLAASAALLAATNVFARQPAAAPNKPAPMGTRINVAPFKDVAYWTANPAERHAQIAQCSAKRIPTPANLKKT